ncbi:MAG: hypothetical protein VB022_00970 [Rikenellaceae bacterium]|nr:hypothetical protein [Rikenellaceae bacterium]
MNKSIRLLPFFLLAGGLTFGQTPDIKSKYFTAEELRRNYRFQEAIPIYKEILEISKDASVNKAVVSSIANCENGLSMLEYGARPKVFGSALVPLKDFFLYYPDISDSTWVLVPQSLNKNKKDYPINNVLMSNAGGDAIFFSAQDGDGKWDIFNIRRIDETKWSSPEPLTTVNSQEDEILPYLSRDGKKLYFSSNGLSGMGGFDLYVSYWNEKQKIWDTPQNLGFPYSSPEDDYLFMDTESGEFSVFASNRDCTSKDSIKLYKLGFESNPVKSPVTSNDEALWISSLQGGSYKKERNKSESSDTIRANPDTSEYTKMIKEFRRLQTEIDESIKQINANRALLSSTGNEEDKAFLAKKIGEDEMTLLEKQSRLMASTQAIQQREMDFLSRGVIIPRDEPTKEKIQEESTAGTIKVKLALYGKLPYMEILEPVVKADYTFRTQGSLTLVEEKEIPEELFYTVQLFLVEERADSASFKGISPIFERKTKTGKFIYTAGRFYTYREASAALQQIKSLGLRDVTLSAFNEGESISVKSARLIEDKVSSTNTYQIKLTNYPEGIPQPVLEILRKSTDKDIAMKPVEGKNIYFVGPFANKTEAESVVSALGELAAEGVSIEAIKNK